MKLNYIDTKEIANIGENLIKYSEEYYSLINDFFDKLTNINSGNAKWTGNKADEYISIVLLDRKAYEDFYFSLREFGELLLTLSSDMLACSNFIVGKE